MQLPNLTINNFRVIRSLSIPRLGYVTLITGKNGSGKTTLLDAIRTYCARGRSEVLEDILVERDEFFEMGDASDDARKPFERSGRFYSNESQIDWRALFNGKNLHDGTQIHIGPTDAMKSLKIRVTPLINEIECGMEDQVEDDMFVLERELGLQKSVIPGTVFDLEYRLTRRVNIASSGLEARKEQRNFPKPIKCMNFGPDRIKNKDLSVLWNRVVLSRGEEYAVDALSLVVAKPVQGVRLISEERRSSRSSRSRQSRVIVKIKGHPRPIHLKRLGDGAVRMFGLAMALSVAENGFVLVDEVENGIHHSIEAPFWSMIFKLAASNNTQVVATTHSWDCVVGFANAMKDQDDSDGGLVRIDRVGENVYPVSYTLDELQAVARHGIEVR